VTGDGYINKLTEEYIDLILVINLMAAWLRRTAVAPLS
jgi:hypothetical protein